MIAIPFKRIITFMIIAALAYVSWLLNDKTQAVKQITDKSIRHDPDYYANNLETYILDETGSPGYYLKTTALTHYPDNNTTELSEPEFLLFKQGQITWSINAASGQIKPDNNKIYLSGNVLAQDKFTKQKTRLKTNTLLLKPESKTAETEAHILIEDSHGKTEATGLSADLNNNRLKLLANVRGVYGNP